MKKHVCSENKNIPFRMQMGLQESMDTIESILLPENLYSDYFRAE